MLWLIKCYGLERFIVYQPLLPDLGGGGGGLFLFVLLIRLERGVRVFMVEGGGWGGGGGGGGGGLCWSRVQPKALKVPPWSPSNSRVATMSAAVPAKLQRILKFKYAKILQQSYIFIFC